jgi:hypothetical protein
MALHVDGGGAQALPTTAMGTQEQQRRSGEPLPRPQRRGGAQFFFSHIVLQHGVSNHQSIEYFHGFQQTSQK